MQSDLWPLNIDNADKVMSDLNIYINQLFRKYYVNNQILYNLLAFRINKNIDRLVTINDDELNLEYKDKILSFLSRYHENFYEMCKDKFENDQISLLDFSSDELRCYVSDNVAIDSQLFLFAYLEDDIDHMRKDILYKISMLLASYVKKENELLYKAPIIKLTFYTTSQIYDNICYQCSINGILQRQTISPDNSLLKIIQMWNNRSISIDTSIIISNFLECDVYGLMDKIKFIELEFECGMHKLMCNTDYRLIKKFKTIDEGSLIPLPFREVDKYIYNSSEFYNTITELEYYIDNSIERDNGHIQLYSLYKDQYKSIVKLFTYENGYIDKWPFDKKIRFTSDCED